MQTIDNINNNFVLDKETIKKLIELTKLYKYIEMEENEQNWLEKMKQNFENIKKYSDPEELSKITWLNLEQIYLISTKTQKIDWHSTYDLDFSSDSSVLKIKWTDKILKFYYNLWVKDILKYHEIQNKLAENEYSVKKEWELEWIKFNKININILKLPTDNIYWTNKTSVSIIPELNEKVKSYEKNNFFIDIIDEIVTEINKVNGFEITKDIHPMNISIQKIENWVLYLTITDIWDSIPKILEKYKKIEEGKSKINNFIESIKDKLASLI